uniref:t-SNARE coiled-coil homology domain-containing protein n=1 Tax=Parastrongyloides trichosuri TaxID=131310 RepID=A0A0N4Z0U4_PARTI
MVRDRLSEFKRKGNQDNEDYSIDRNSSMNGAPLADQSTRTQLFFETINEINSSIDQLQERVEAIKSKQSEILLQTVVQSTDKNQLEEIIGDIKSTIRILRSRVKRIEADIRSEEMNGTMKMKTGADLKIRKNQCEFIKRRLNDVLFLFNQTQIDYKSRVSKRVKRQLNMSGENLTESEVNSMLGSHSEEIFFKTLNPISLAGRMALEDAEARHKEIINLENSISELQDIFTDVYDLVKSQSFMVDNIATNIESAVDYTDEGRVNVVQAVRHKRAALKKKIFVISIITLILIILIVVAIILGVVLGGKKN